MTGFGKRLKSLSWRTWWKHSQEDWVRMILSNCSALIRIGWHHNVSHLMILTLSEHFLLQWNAGVFWPFHDDPEHSVLFQSDIWSIWTAVKHHTVRMSFPRRCGDRRRGELQRGTKTALLSCPGLCPQKQHPNYGWGDGFYRHGHGKTTSTEDHSHSIRQKSWFGKP